MWYFCDGHCMVCIMLWLCGEWIVTVAVLSCSTAMEEILETTSTVSSVHFSAGSSSDTLPLPSLSLPLSLLPTDKNSLSEDSIHHLARHIGKGRVREGVQVG